MAGTNINRVIITGNLTRDPELRSTGSGMAVCGLRIATNTRRKDSASGEWVDKANYFDVTIFGRQGENAAQDLTKGRPVAIDGRLEWREFTDQQGNKRQAVDIIADNVQFLGGPGEGGGGSGGSFTPRSDVPVSTDDFAPAGAPNGGGGGGGGYGGGQSTAADDDIPF
jgi:single-strand DNA-binding protein